LLQDQQKVCELETKVNQAQAQLFRITSNLPSSDELMRLEREKTAYDYTPPPPLLLSLCPSSLASPLSKLPFAFFSFCSAEAAPERNCVIMHNGLKQTITHLKGSANVEFIGVIAELAYCRDERLAKLLSEHLGTRVWRDRGVRRGKEERGEGGRELREWY
jgi:hypothetical protein